MQRVAAAASLAMILLVMHAAPASAHRVPGVDATNFRSTLTAVVPAAPELRVRVIEAGSRLEVTNRGSVDMVVLSDAGVPYLRIGPGGIFENRCSYEAYAIRKRYTSGATIPPPSKCLHPVQADDRESPDPRWVKVAEGQTARWHEHRIHTAYRGVPEAVRIEPDRHRVIRLWTVPMRIGDRAVEVRGALEWVPPRTARPWVALSAVLLIGVACLGLTRAWHRALAVAVGVLLAIDVVHLAGLSLARGGSIPSRLGAGAASSYYVVLAYGAGITVIVLLRRRAPEGPFLAAAVGGFVAVSAGLLDLADLMRSQVPFAWGATLERLLVATALGGGPGVALAAIIGARRAATPIRGTASGRANAGASPTTS